MKFILIINTYREMREYTVCIKSPFTILNYYNFINITLFFGVQVAPYTKRKHVKFMISKERLIL